MTDNNHLAVRCLLKGDYDTFMVEVPLSADVGFLKKAIREERKCTLRDADSADLILTKVDVPMDAIRYILSVFSIGSNEKMLYTDYSIKDCWRNPPQSGFLHVFVESPSLGKLSPTRPYPFPLDILRRLPIQREPNNDLEKYRKIHDAIKAFPNEPPYDTPAYMGWLPFPSPIPTTRFDSMVDDDGVKCFRYMGRSKFEEIIKATMHEAFDLTREKIYLYSSSGFGTSHMLAALAFKLIREGKRVVYIPDCNDLAIDLEGTLRTALSFTFYDSALAPAIQSASVEDLQHFWSGQKGHYLLVDQLNALEKYNNQGEEIQRLLDDMRRRHHYIVSTSANQKHRKQYNTAVIDFHGGMNQDEMEHWRQHFCTTLPSLSEEDWQVVEHLTGRVPLLLRALFRFKREGEEFTESEFRMSAELRKVSEDVAEFLCKVEKYGAGDSQRFDGVMQACVLGGQDPDTPMNSYDLRYFYVDHDYFGHCVCGVARETMMDYLHKRKLIP